MTQRIIIRWIPVEIFVLCLVTGWLATSAIRVLIAGVPPVEASAAPSVSVTELSPVFSPEIQHWAPQILGWSKSYGLDPNLVATVMQIESCGLPNAVSRSGAQGLFQVMPFHFSEGEDMQHPDTNAGRGLAYLALGLQKAGGDAGLALAGYNGGHSLIGLDGALWPEQTQRYWYWGTGIYEDAVNGQAQSGRLQEWLRAGGASLCARAADELNIR